MGFLEKHYNVLILTCGSCGLLQCTVYDIAIKWQIVHGVLGS